MLNVNNNNDVVFEFYKGITIIFELVFQPFFIKTQHTNQS